MHISIVAAAFGRIAVMFSKIHDRTRRKSIEGINFVYIVHNSNVRLAISHNQERLKQRQISAQRPKRARNRSKNDDFALVGRAADVGLVVADGLETTEVVFELTDWLLQALKSK